MGEKLKVLSKLCTRKRFDFFLPSSSSHSGIQQYGKTISVMWVRGKHKKIIWPNHRLTMLKFIQNSFV